MELSKECTEALSLFSDTNKIPNPTCTQILKNTSSAIFSQNQGSKYDGKGILKEAFFGAITLMLEAAKHDVDEATLVGVLEECKISSERTMEFVTHYKKEKKHIQAYLNSYGHHFPCVTNVNWRLDYTLKKNSVEKLSCPIYLVKMQTDKDDENSEIQFSCTVEELQDLVGKLKDAVKSLENNARG